MSLGVWNPASPAARTPWTAWPAADARERGLVAPSLRILANRPGKWREILLRSVVPVAMIYSVFSDHRTRGWGESGAAAGAVSVCALLIWAFMRATRRHALLLSLSCAALLLGGAALAQWQGFSVAVVMLAFGCAIVSLQRLPLAAAAPIAGVALGGYAVATHETWLSTAITLAGIGLAGYVMRVEAESRHRLAVQERAARAAEAESAALGERARIARDIHDVLAHSLSAQLVHLEAARLRIEQEEPGPFRDQILERVVAARSMAREGLSETRQALSALRGEMAPLGDYLREVAASDGAEIEVAGTPRPVPAEASQTVRRVAQEALTNVRKHAPGARVRIDLTYGPGELLLYVRDWGGKGLPPVELASSGSGYGLLGMRERAELIGGTLDAGPEESGGKGYSVRLRVPA
ncbi:sensor histidine kinase [Streptomyces sp. 8L]|uniref:sensor histidine kinase n=1 Tax=Streptomyces sp. 8L TaxID=2877242 RepID=UPI001CD497B2|nr:histidine kinase [Streptomyces sp. 8L]MCA1219675.1 histidine kinase [Streptomyces sp. 8L]